MALETVNIPVEEFKTLLKAKGRLELLVDVIVDTATLNYDKTGVSFNDELLFSLLKSIDDVAIQDKLDQLLAKARNSDITTIKAV